MTSPQENNEFERLLVLLRLKRHELPPPGYSLRFSSNVIARIEAEGAARPQGWWRGFLARFESNPVLAGAYCVAVGGLLVVGMGFSQVLGREQVSTLPGAGTWLATIPAPANTPVALPSSEGLNQVFPHAANTSAASSLDPMWTSEAPSFLIEGAGVRTERVGFRLQGR